MVSSGKLEKAKIYRVDNLNQPVLTCLYNPAELAMNRVNKWSDKPQADKNVGQLAFAGGDPQSLKIDLFFDTTADSSDVRQYTGILLNLMLIVAQHKIKVETYQVKEAYQVTKYKTETYSEQETYYEETLYRMSFSFRRQTLYKREGDNYVEVSQDERRDEKITFYLQKTRSVQKSRQIPYQETEYRNVTKTREIRVPFKAPPLCVFGWGKFRSFEGYLKSVSIKFTAFLPDGTPVRATANTELVEYLDESRLAPQNPTSLSAARKTHLVLDGETLDWIAYEEYGDPGYWRHIAQANKLVNPRLLAPGLVLTLPPLS
jgi:hypothetical protein